MFHRRAAHPSGPANAARGASGPAAREAAPALFRLLADSALYRAAMAASRVPLALLDAQRAGMPFVFVNPAFEQLCGYAERDAIGRPASLTLATRGNEGTLAAQLAASSEANTGLRVACRVRRRDATEHEAFAAFDPVRDGRGKLTHWIVAFEDSVPPR